MQVAVSARGEAGEAIRKGVAWMKNDLLRDWWCSFILPILYSSSNNTHPHQENRSIATLSTSQSRIVCIRSIMEHPPRLAVTIAVCRHARPFRPIIISVFLSPFVLQPLFVTESICLSRSPAPPLAPLYSRLAPLFFVLSTMPPTRHYCLHALLLTPKFKCPAELACLCHLCNVFSPQTKLGVGLWGRNGGNSWCTVGEVIGPSID